MDTKNFIDEILTLNNPLLYALVMTIFGKLISMSPLENKHITWILPVIGCPLYCLLEGWTGRHLMEGFVVGYAAIGLNQNLRQFIPQKTNGKPEAIVTPPPAPPTT